jgi:hypothetical protein
MRRYYEEEEEPILDDWAGWAEYCRQKIAAYDYELEPIKPAKKTIIPLPLP